MVIVKYNVYGVKNYYSWAHTRR